MATYAEFFKFGLSGKIIPAVGDRSVVRLDGRCSYETMKKIAESECRKRNFVGWQIIKGSSLLQATPITKIVML